MADPYFSNVGLLLRAKPYSDIGKELTLNRSAGTVNFVSSNKKNVDNLHCEITNEVTFNNTHSFKITPTRTLYSEVTFDNMLLYNKDFTIDFKFHLTTLDATNPTMLFEMYSASSYALGISCLITNTGEIQIKEDSIENKISGGLVIAGVNHHLEFSKEGNTIRLFLDGILLSTTTTVSLYQVAIGRIIFGNKLVHSMVGFNRATGYIDDYRVTLGVCRHTTDFTPPDENNYSVHDITDIAPKNHYRLFSVDLFSNFRRDILLNGVTVLSRMVESVYHPESMNSTGTGTFSGIASIDGVPGKYRVFLFERIRKLLIRTTMSDINGNYTFNYLKLDVDYFAICEDYESKIIRKNAAVRDFIRL